MTINPYDIRARLAKFEQDEINERLANLKRTVDLTPTRRNLFRVVNSADLGATDIYLYGPVRNDGNNPDGEGVTPKQVIAGIKSVKTPIINLHVNSPGGDVFAGLAIHNALAKFTGWINTHVDGIAASIASVIALAGDEIKMADNARIMIHEPTGMAIGNADEMRRTAELLESITDTLADLYVKRTGQSASYIRQAMAAETWYTATEAKRIGFVDEVTDLSPVLHSDRSVAAYSPEHGYAVAASLDGFGDELDAHTAMRIRKQIY